MKASKHIWHGGTEKTIISLQYYKVPSRFDKLTPIQKKQASKWMKETIEHFERIRQDIFEEFPATITTTNKQKGKWKTNQKKR